MESDDTNKDSPKSVKCKVPKKHKVPLICPNPDCGVTSYYRSDICWLCQKPLTTKEKKDEI